MFYKEGLAVAALAVIIFSFPGSAVAANEDFVNNPPPIDSELEGAPTPGTPPSPPAERPSRSSGSSNNQGFVPLIPIGELGTGNTETSLADYFNNLFLLVISIGAMIAVLRLVYGGFLYMTQTESIKRTATARDVIQGTLVGLLLLIGAVLILQTVNPAIVNLKVLNFAPLQGPTYRGGGAENDRGSIGPVNVGDSKTFDSSSASINRNAAKAFVELCKRNGGNGYMQTSKSCPSGEKTLPGGAPFCASSFIFAYTAYCDPAGSNFFGNGVGFASEIIAWRDGGYKTQVVDAVRAKAGFTCTNQSGSDCSNLAYPIVNINYASSYVEITVQDLSDPSSETYGQTVTKRVSSFDVKRGVCTRSLETENPAPGC